MRFTIRDDRYEPYAEIVARAERVAYITTHNPILDRYLRQGFEAKGVTWQENRIGDYLVYYNLSQRIQPEDIGLGGEQG